MEAQNRKDNKINKDSNFNIPSDDSHDYDSNTNILNNNSSSNNKKLQNNNYNSNNSNNNNSNSNMKSYPYLKHIFSISDEN